MPDGGPPAPSQSNHKNIFSDAVKCLSFKKICNITYWLQSLILTCNFKSLLTAKPHLSTWGIAHVSVLLAQIPAAPDSSSLCLFQAKVWPTSTPKEWTQVLISFWHNVFLIVGAMKLFHSSDEQLIHQWPTQYVLAKICSRIIIPYSLTSDCVEADKGGRLRQNWGC